MDLDGEIYFGDKTSFAIRYVPGYAHSNGHHYAYCHLCLAGQIVGDKNESCDLDTWIYGVEELKNRIKSHLGPLRNGEFNNKSDNELFELLIKANQLTEDFNPEFDYLPVLENKIWANCSISVDETTDAFAVFITESGGVLKFLWKGLRAPAPIGKIGQLFSIIVGKDLVVQAIQDCLDRIKEECLNYPVR